MAMSKTTKRVLLGTAAVPLVLVAAVAGNFYGALPKMRAAPDVKVTSTPEAVERGKYLANHVAGCLACHSRVDEMIPGEPAVPGQEGAGRTFAMPGFPGVVRAPNLTPDPDHGIGKHTDGELVRAVREGIGKDGHALFPMMPYATYAKSLSDEDLHAVIAYLRTLPAVKNDPGKTEINFPVSMFIRGVPRPVTTPPPPAPKEGAPGRGEWLLQMASCHDCHDTSNERMEKLPGMELAGGTKFTMPDGTVVYSANITSDKATGIGAYSDDDLRRVMLDGKTKSGRSLYVMPFAWYRGLSASDMASLIAALRATRPIANVVAASSRK